MDKLCIVSLNVRGLRDGVKRRRVFRYLKRMNADIALLQEMHSSKDIEEMWSNEWGNKIIYSNGTNNSKGVAILFTKRFAKTLHSVERDTEGRFVKCQCKINGCEYSIMNVYGPNVDDPHFFSALVKRVAEESSINCIIGGDFNVVTDGDMDCNSGKVYHNNAKKIIDKLIEEYEFTDVWRSMHPDCKFYTWMKARLRDSWS